MSSNEILRDAAIRHAIQSERFSKGLATKIVKLLNSADADIVATLAKRLALIEERGRDLGPVTTKRLEVLLNELRQINEAVYKRVASGLKADLVDYASYEVDWAANGLKDATWPTVMLTLPPANYLATLVETSPIDGHLLKSWTDHMSTRRHQRIEQAIRVGLVEGEGLDKIITRVRGTKANNYTDGILNISRNSAQSLVLTASSTIANNAREEVYKRNSRLIKKLKWVSTLDSRTSPICQSRDGQLYDLDKPHPTAPAHIRCRSLLIPITKSFDELGLEDRQNVPPRYRASMNGRVSGDETLETLVPKWPKDQQDELLGAGRAQLVRDGKVKFRDLFRDNGTHKSLAELRRAEGLAPEGPAKADAAPPSAPDASRPRTFSPINRDVGDATVKVGKRLDAQRHLTAQMAKNAADPRYDPVPEFRAVKPEHFGKATFPTGFSDASASMIRAIMPEVDAITDRFNIPRLRGMRQVGGPVANMGDGLLGMNPHYFNGFASKIGDAGDGGGAAVKKRDDLISQMKAVKTELEDVRARMLKAKEAGDRDRAFDLYARQTELAREYNALIKPFNKVSKEISRAKVGASETVTSWKPGDDAAAQPQVTTDYFSGMDRARDVIFHETGHHLHQMYGKQGRRSRNNLPPLEVEIERVFLRKYYGVSTVHQENAARQVSRYAKTNSKEWFAENFALYMMGRHDIVDQDVKEIIERLLDEQSN
ncbi:hypothetical protein ASE85_03305 [Sphingobium sp. Leaf26]|uniref:minor capsid protein n=1 Tax=Sphingobium sp. Leaf26 TaxID=1735693 RepID=UPI0006F4635F|nr:minor capsid protein [Sphingobium sp. Leaf26]KQN09971.1 hypothetical protein ASE85_03305 [Sphingobium sp. Leaf26]